MAELFTSENLIALLTLTSLEIVLGIDNIVFISILVQKLPKAQQAGARRIGLLLAMVMRIALLLAISWVMSLTKPLFTLFEHGFTGRDLILIIGGFFLVAKATWEIHDKLEGGTHEHAAPKTARFGAILLQIMLLDIVFSLDSVITAVGMARDVEIMIAAVVISIGVMLVAAGSISAFIEQAPDHEDAGALVPAADRRDADRRRLRPARLEGLHLHRDGVLALRRGAEHAHPQAARRAGGAAPELRRREA